MERASPTPGAEAARGRGRQRPLLQQTQVPVGLEEAAPPVIDQPEAAAAETAPATRPAEVTSPDASAAPDEEAGTPASRPASLCRWWNRI